jgi:pimeloyl-ACP methyl ester carboxylesterase
VSRKILKGILFAGAALLLFFLLGPQVSTSVEVRENELPEIEGLSGYLEASESKVPHLIRETKKRIAWAGEENVVTPISFVYLHGFSDSNRVQGNSIDRIAAEFGANVFYTRFAGHGYDYPAGIEALGEATLQMWADDAIEALRIGQLIGNKVVMIGFSTGAPLAAWASTVEREADGLILISPNFGLRDRMSELAIGPWGRQFVRIFKGEVTVYSTPAKGQHKRYSTGEYYSNAIVTMMATVKMGRSADLERITSPVLVVYSPNDQFIAPEAFREAVEKMAASETKEHAVASRTGHPDEHVLMGDLVSSEEVTNEVEVAIVNFVRSHLSKEASNLEKE